MSARTGGGGETEQVRTRGEGSIFRDFVRTYFMDGPKRVTSYQGSTSAVELKTGSSQVYGILPGQVGNTCYIEI